MRTTIKLPDDLVRDLKLRAAHERRSFNEVAADLLRIGLSNTSSAKKMPKLRILKDKRTGLPVIECPTAPSAVVQLYPDDLVSILLEQETEWLDSQVAEGRDLRTAVDHR